MDKLIDMYGNEYVIHDIITFKEHIFKYHTLDGKPDGSIHEENGYYFKVDHEFYNKLKNL
jgi:tRNA G37 N-methylase Trm5